MTSELTKEPDAIPAPSSRRNLVNAACGMCRRRKLKCTGERPSCGRCKIKGDTCTYVTQTQSETRSGALRRRFDLTEASLASFKELFQALQKIPAKTATSVFEKIRSGTSVEDLMSHLRSTHNPDMIRLVSDNHFEYDVPLGESFPASVKDADNAYLASLLFEAVLSCPSPGSRHAKHVLQTELAFPEYCIPYHAAKLVDSQLDRVKAHPWTKVTSDNSLVQDLLRTYFVHEYAYVPIFHKDVFLEDMVANATEFCSPLLVNAILALAWHGRLAARNRAEFWDPTSLGHQFLVEAIHHWRMQESHTTLTTVQATLIIWIITVIDGQDEYAWPWMTHTIAIANDLALFTSTAAERTPKQRAVRCITAWSIFTCQAQICFHFHRSPLLEELPSFPLPSADDAGLYFGELCIIYPHMQIPVAMQHAATFRANAQLRVIMNSMAKDWYGKGTDQLPGVRDPYQRSLQYRSLLQDWYEALPVELSPRRIFFPSALKAHMLYRTLVIYLCEPFIDATPLDIYFNPAKSEEARRALRSSRCNLEMLVRLYYKRHGCAAWDSAVILFLFVVAANALRESLDTNTEPQIRRAALHTMIFCGKCLADQAVNTYLAEAAFRGLRNSMQYWQARMMGVYVQVKDDEQREKLIKKYLRSKWPIQLSSIYGDPAKEHLGTLFWMADDGTVPEQS